MKIMMVSLFLFCLGQGIIAQTYTVADGDVTTCTGLFYDTGGKMGNYSTNEDYVFTMNSGNLEATFVLDFNYFKLGGNDWLAVYDGNSVEAKLIDTYTNSNPLSGRITSSVGSFTFVFHSSGQSFEAGWEARVSCEGDNTQNVQNLPKKGPWVILTYSVRGMKSEADYAILDKLLKQKSYVVGSTFNFQKEMLWVTATESSYLDEIKQILLASKDSLGYEVAVDFLSSSR